MANETHPPTPIEPAAAAVTKDNATQDGDGQNKMVRSISMDIREEREDLKRAAEHNLNAILELNLAGQIKWVSPTWQDLTGVPSSKVLGRPVRDVVVDEEDVFGACVEAMRNDDSKSRIVRFSIASPRLPLLHEEGSGDETPIDGGRQLMGVEEHLQQSTDSPRNGKTTEHDNLDLEAQGIMVYNRATGEEDYTMWMIKPAIFRQITIDLPDLLIESLGIGAEMLANYLTLLADVGVNDPEHHPPPMPVLCRICERQIVPWWFEKHTELCAQDHRAEMEVQMSQESLIEQRSALVKVLDALEAQSRQTRMPPQDLGSPAPIAKAEYKGLPIGFNPNPSPGSTSGRASPATLFGRSQEMPTGTLTHHRARSFAVRRPLARIVELVLDLCDTAIEISTPSVKDSKTSAPGEIRAQSPQSESRIQQVVQWQSPSASTLETEQGLALLCDDTSQLAKAKVEAVLRHRRILEYSERIRVEYEVLVSECIEAALQKAARIKAGELSDSSEDSQYESAAEQEDVEGIDADAENDTDNAQDMSIELPPAEDPLPAPPPKYVSTPSAMAIALRNVSGLPLERPLSSSNSSRTSSPRGARTPKSRSGPHEQAYPFHKRGSLAVESDTGAESDSSLHSSVTSGTNRRAESPSAEMTLSRVTSTRSRERKRHSLVLPSLVASGSTRSQSPGRGPPPPASPLRTTKSRFPSGGEALPSPIVSPVFTQSEFTSPIIRPQRHHHRRQSSAALSDALLGRPSSPRLSQIVSNPQPRVVQPSIKDFEIIKPISKGAFGSVYLAKKKSTGDYYAIKVLKKADMVAKNQVTNVKAERAIMMWQGESDLVAKLYWTFSSEKFLFLVMEYLNGGDCASLIKAIGALPEDWTKKYIAEVVLCVQHLHNRQIVHRDLKPDNLLIDAKGHLKLTDFGLSRMGLRGRQQRAIEAKPGDAPPDLLKTGPFRRAPSVASSRSTSFDFQGVQSEAQTPSMTPAAATEFGQPSYFTLAREHSREPSRRASGCRSDSGDSDALSVMFRRFSIADGRTPIEEETASDEGGESPDPYALHPVTSTASNTRTDTPPQGSSMPPPIMGLFDPEDKNQHFVGTPDYLAPETIKGAVQDEMSDWWSLGCILFECLYGRPPFNDDTPKKVFQNIQARKIAWPTEDDGDAVSEEAKDLVDRLMCLDPRDRLGANKNDTFSNGGDEIKAHPWFADIQWDTLREDEASFIPASENPEDVEYFDARGATMENFAAEFDEQHSSPTRTPGAEYPDRPYDALSRTRSQVNAVKRNLMPLHIPPHVRSGRSRRQSEPLIADDFGNFQFRNLPVLEKANKDVIQKLRVDAMNAQAKSAGTGSSAGSPGLVAPSPAPSLDSSPVLPMPVKRTLSQSRAVHNRPQSPSLLSQAESSPSRGSHPSSPLLVSFAAGQNHERRKTSSGSSTLSQLTGQGNLLHPVNLFEQAPYQSTSLKNQSTVGSPVKGGIPKPSSLPLPLTIERSGSLQRKDRPSSPRHRSYTVGSQDGDLVPELIPPHHKRRSGVFEVSPSSSDNEETKHQQALLRVQRRRASSRRLSQVSLVDGPSFRTLDVLVCEDHPVSRLVMERLLEKLRCRTIAVTNGSEAIRYATSEVKFDMIMMEYKLPHLSGSDVARMIRTTKNVNSHTPIVAVTGYLKELQAPHHFDALVEKPPTKEKLEEVIGRLCQWRASIDGWRPSLPYGLPSSTLRQSSMPADDSPTTTTSSSAFGGYGPALSSSYVPSVSSRCDSIGSLGLTSEIDGQHDSIPGVVISRQATNEWTESDLERNFGALGITSPGSLDPNSNKERSSYIVLSEPTSAPPSLDRQEFSLSNLAPRKKPPTEAILAKRLSYERLRQDSAAESGDDEDEDLGHVQIRSRSPRRNQKRQSKLGIEMMRTNSQGSVISVEEILSGSAAVRDVSGASLPSVTSVPMIIPEEETVASPPSLASLEDLVGGSKRASGELKVIPADIIANGRLTPPEIFPPRPGDHVENIVESDRDGDAISDGNGSGNGNGNENGNDNGDDLLPEDSDATPRPSHHALQLDMTPTPRAPGSP